MAEVETRRLAAEIFGYDIAVRTDFGRRGIERQLVAELRKGAAKAGISNIRFPADNDDLPATGFYRTLGGGESAVLHFVFERADH